MTPAALSDRIDALVAELQQELRLEVERAALAPPALEGLKAILERHRGKAETHLAVCLDDVRCVMRLGPRWMVSPTPAFHQEVQRWRQSAQI